jgi:hypothetical protein
MENKRPDAEQNDDQNLPGYPHYAPHEDIMNAGSGKKNQVDLDVENLSRANTHLAGEQGKQKKAVKSTAKDDLGLDDDSNVTEDEKNLLEATSISTFSADEENLSRATLDNTDEDGDPLNEGTGYSGNNLDVPGSEDDDDMEDIGEEDEENNYYGVGGDRQEPGEESKGD